MGDFFNVIKINILILKRYVYEDVSIENIILFFMEKFIGEFVNWKKKLKSKIKVNEINKIKS